MEWQPIETAPKDGGAILIWDGNRMMIAWWVMRPQGGHGWWSADRIWMQPTDWAPLPDPPEEPSENTETAKV